MPRPVTPETRAEIVRLHGEGLGRNAIARELQVSAAVVTKIAQQEGLAFDRAATEIAVRARQLDLADASLLLAQTMVVAAQDGLERLDGPYLVYNFGGKENTYTEELLDAAPSDVRAAAMRSAGIAFDKARRIVERSNPGLERAEGILDAAASMFEAAAATIRANEQAAASADAAPA